VIKSKLDTKNCSILDVLEDFRNVFKKMSFSQMPVRETAVGCANFTTWYGTAYS